MDFEINKEYSGFKLIQQQDVKDVSSVGRVFIHEKSGAVLVSLENSDDNKVFSISFKTLPDNDTGVFHILEHSVLCGSRKFPTKEPFVELAKGSLNTFLNAATYPDKTMYPIASKNDKDFMNLMDVYLDAVFYPNIYKYPEIFKQEGWHYELTDPSAPVDYKGVVFNEMKGVYSSPESMLFRGISHNLFKDTCYAYDSGGDPKKITDLTYDEFLNYHKKFYHPSNSYIYLYGDMNIEEKLKFIDENYLCNFDKRDNNDIYIKEQKPFNKIEDKTIEYPIDVNEDDKDKTYMSINFALNDVKDSELYIAFDLLEDILLETSASPLKKALLKSNICKDVFGVYNNGESQTSMNITIKNSNEDKKEQFKSIVYETLEAIAKDGIDKNLIKAVINTKVFDLKEGDYSVYPKGLVYCEKVIGSILYGGDAFQNLEFNHIIEKIEDNIDNNYFENLISKYLLNNNHVLILSVIPKKGLTEENTALERKKLDDYKSKLDSNKIQEIIDTTKSLLKRQSTPDTKEDLMKIPLLSIKDVDRKAETHESDLKDEGNYKLLSTQLTTNGIDYVYMYFDASYIKEDQIPYASLLSYLLSKLSTKKHSYEELSNEIKIYTGGIDFDISAYSDIKNAGEFYPKFTVSGKCLHENKDVLLNLIFEVINSTAFEDKDRVKEVFYELKSRLESVISNGGIRIVGSRLNSYYSKGSVYGDRVSGLYFYKFILDLSKNFDKKYDEILKNLKEVSSSIFNVKNLLVVTGASKDDMPSLNGEIENAIKTKISNKDMEKYQYNFKLEKKNEGLLTSSNVQYVGKGNNYIKLGFKYTGSFLVLRTIANYDYLWNNVRVKGGAYGVFISFRRNGNMSICSYRDPNISETIDVYNNFGKYLESFSADEREMTKYILGTINALDTPLTNSMICEKKAVMYIGNISKEDVQLEREQVLDTKAEDIKALKDVLDKCMEENYLCVLGGKEKIESNAKLFKNLVNVFE